MATADNLICLAGMSWAGRWTTRQQLMVRLARGRRVLYVTHQLSPLSPFTGLHHELRPRDLWRRPLRLRRMPLEGELWVGTPPPGLPLRYQPAGQRLNLLILGAWLRRVQRQLDLAAPVLWSFLPEAGPLFGRLGERLAVYHALDDHAAYPLWWLPAAAIRHTEVRTARRADLVFAASRTLAARLQAINPRTVLLPPGVDADAFARPPNSEPAALAAIPHPRIGLVGRLDARVDSDLLCGLLAARPDWQFVFVGPVGGLAQADTLARQPNAHFLGEQPRAALPAYLHGLDLGLIPYRQGRATGATFPLKFWEYLAAGLPVASGYLPELEPHADREVLRLARDLSGMVAAIDEMLREKGTVAEAKRRALASANTWEARVAEVERRLATAQHRGSTSPGQQTPPDRGYRARGRNH